MKRIIFVLIVLILASISLSYSETPFWELELAPPNGNVMDISVDQNNTLFCASYNGLFKSTDYGSSWDWVLDGYVWALASGNNNVIYAMRQESEVNIFSNQLYYSNDNGTTWQTYPQFWSDSLIPLYIISDKNNLLMVLSRDPWSFDSKYEYYYSKDDGKNWEKIWQLGGNGYLSHNYAQKPNMVDSIIIQPIVVGNNTTMMVSRDLCKTWEEQELPTPVLNVYIKSKLEIYLLTYDGVYFSENSCKTWKPKWLPGKYVKSFLIANDSLIYAGSGNRIYFSTDHGNNWDLSSGLDSLNDGYPLGLNITSIKADGKNNLYCSPTPYGIYKSSDKGKTWQENNNGLSATWNDANIGYCNSDIYVSQWGMYKSGTSWKDWNYSGLKTCALSNIAVNSKGYIFVGDRSVGGTEKGIFRSTDKGKTWENFREGSLSINAIIKNSKDILFAAIGAGYIFRSTDDGENWEEMDAEGCYLAINDEDHIFCFGGGEIFRSTDNGDTWEEILKVSRDPSLIDYGGILVFNKRTKTAWYYLGNPAPGVNGILKTTDNGRTWFRDYDMYYSEPPIGLYNLAVDSTYNWVTTGIDGVYRSTDNGKTWYRMDTTGFRHKQLGKLSVSPEGYIYVFGFTGGLYRSHDRFVSVKEQVPESSEIIISNSPNPFSEKTEITYSVPHPGYVSISITDILGRVLFKQPNEFKESGSYSFTFRLEGISSGAYYLVMQNDGRQVTKIMQLLE